MQVKKIWENFKDGKVCLGKIGIDALGVIGVGYTMEDVRGRGNIKVRR
jgi:hypothetical protein